MARLEGTPKPFSTAPLKQPREGQIVGQDELAHLLPERTSKPRLERQREASFRPSLIESRCAEEKRLTRAVARIRTDPCRDLEHAIVKKGNPHLERMRHGHHVGITEKLVVQVPADLE
jgi:hypothetical protein